MPPSAEDCLFCKFAAEPERHVASNGLAFAVRDGFPVNPGHTLIIPRRHLADWFDAAPYEQAAIMELAGQVRDQLLAEAGGAPDGFNIGINVGAAAGQTVMHLHVHVIPRFVGDVDDPRGGVRYVIPSKGNYERPGYVAGVSDAQPENEDTD